MQKVSDEGWSKCDFKARALCLLLLVSCGGVVWAEEDKVFRL